MRARNIKPGFYKNDALAECSVWARLLFPGLWMLADREGRLEDRPKRIKAEIFPYDDTDIDRLLDELHREKLIIRYNHGEKRFIQIAKFSDHQRPHSNEAQSEIPEYSDDCSPLATKVESTSDHGNPHARVSSSLNPSSLNPEEEPNGSPVTRSRTYPPDFERFWKLWPEARRKEKPKALTAWREAMRRATPEEIFDSMECYLQSREVREGFAPYPAKWLKGDRWQENHMADTGEQGGDDPDAWERRMKQRYEQKETMA